MRRSDITPYLRASQDTVRAEKWEIELDGSYSELEETLPTWDQNTALQLRCLCDLDVERLQHETGVAADDMAWSVGWQVQETGLVSDPTLSPLRTDGKHEFHLTLRPEKTGPTLEITRSIVLRTTRATVSPIEARWAGSVLWEDVTRLRLGSTTADFPVALLEFASSHLRRFRHNSWYLELPDSADHSALGSMLLLINTADVALTDAATAIKPNKAQGALLANLEESLTEQLVVWALERWGECETAPPGSAGAAAQILALGVLGEDVTSWTGAGHDTMKRRARIIEGWRTKLEIEGR